jgi:predicted nuclease with TOPRIM domain
MSNEKYLNYYVEILTSTMTDAVIRNISLQSNARVTEDVIQEIEFKINNLENAVKEHLDTINHLNIQMAELNKMKTEYENVKHQVQHVNVFRNELSKEREKHQKTRTNFENQIKELNDKIEYLQLTPVKRKKIDDEKNKVVEVLKESSVLPIIDDTTKDGGSF